MISIELPRRPTGTPISWAVNPSTYSDQKCPTDLIEEPSPRTLCTAFLWLRRSSNPKAYIPIIDADSLSSKHSLWLASNCTVFTSSICWSSDIYSVGHLSALSLHTTTLFPDTFDIGSHSYAKRNNQLSTHLS